MIKIILLATLSLTTIGYSAETPESLSDALERVREQLRILPSIPIEDERVGVHGGLEGTVIPGEMIVNAETQARVNALFKDATRRGDIPAIDQLFDRYPRVRPDQRTLNLVVLRALKADHIAIIQGILSTAVAREDNVIAHQILTAAMTCNDIPLAQEVFLILVPNPGERDAHGRPFGLLDAAKIGYTDIVLAYLNHEISHVAVDQWGVNQALEDAAWKGHRDVVLAMLDPDQNKGVQPDQEGINWALGDAVYNGNRNLVLAMLDPEKNKGGQPDQEGVNKALWHAVIDGHRDLVLAILDPDQNKGVQPDQEGINWALADAARYGHRDLVLAMLAPDQNKGFQPDQEGINKALKFAAEKDRTNVVLAMLDPDQNKGVKPNQQGVLGALSLRILSSEIRALLEAALKRLQADQGVASDGAAAGGPKNAIQMNDFAAREQLTPIQTVEHVAPQKWWHCW